MGEEGALTVLSHEHYRALNLGFEYKYFSVSYPKPFQAFKEFVSGNNVSNLVHLDRIRGKVIKEILRLIEDL